MVLNLRLFSEFMRAEESTVHLPIPWVLGRVHWGLTVSTVKLCASGTGHNPLLPNGCRAILIASSLLKETGLDSFFVNKAVNAQELLTCQPATLMEAVCMAQTANCSGQSRAWDGGRQVDS